MRDRLAENLHEMWAMSKIEQGWKFGEIRDDQRKTNPSLTNFEKLPKSEKKYVVTVAYETLRQEFFFFKINLSRLKTTWYVFRVFILNTGT